MNSINDKSYHCIQLDIDRWVATITMSLPEKMNALGNDILLEMQHALRALEANRDIRAVVITGAGRAFSSGFDLSPREKPFTTVQDWREHANLGNETFLLIWRSRLPVIAAVNGFCLGGGCELSMACDFTLAADDAQFGEPEIQFQSAPPMMIMPWVLGMKKRGFQATIDYGAEMFALIHLLDSPEKQEFFGIAQAKGLKAAFKWRDEKFQAR